MEAAESTAGRRAPAKKRNNRAATVKRTMQAREACGERATLLVPYASLPAATCAGKALGARPLANLHLHTPPPGSVLYLPALAGALDSMKSFLGGAATGKPLRSTKWKTPAFALNLRGRVTHRVSLGFSRGKRVPAFAVYGTAWLPLALGTPRRAKGLAECHCLVGRFGECPRSRGIGELPPVLSSFRRRRCERPNPQRQGSRGTCGARDCRTC